MWEGRVAVQKGSVSEDPSNPNLLVFTSPPHNPKSVNQSMVKATSPHSRDYVMLLKMRSCPQTPSRGPCRFIKCPRGESTGSKQRWVATGGGGEWGLQQRPGPGLHGHRQQSLLTSLACLASDPGRLRGLHAILWPP